MSDPLKLTNAKLLLVLATAGVIALIAFELIRALNGTPMSVDGLPDEAFLIGLLSASAAPVLLLCVPSSRIVKWTAFGLATLLALLHALHFIEHVLEQDYALTVLILITMFLPTSIAAISIWNTNAYNRDNG